MKKVKEFFIKLAGIVSTIDWVGIPKSTYLRYITTFLVVLNQILVFTGHSPINYDENEISNVIGLILTIAIVFINTWKDNPVTKIGLYANNIMKTLKSMSPEEAEQVMITFKLALEKKEKSKEEEAAELETPEESGVEDTEVETEDDPELLDK